MRGCRMEVLWRIVAALSCDCFKDSSSSRSPAQLSWSPAGSLDGSSLTGSWSLGPGSGSLGPDPPRCQSCVSQQARLKRLSCGHLYCDPCCHHIVNLAFEDIEGLSDYPCPACRAGRGPPETPQDPHEAPRDHQEPQDPCAGLQDPGNQQGSRWG